MNGLNKLRENYTKGELNLQDFAKHPVAQFQVWMEQALESKILEPNAMILGTADVHNNVSQRTVLLKGLSEEGFVWYTNYNSQKAKDLAANPKAGLLFLWLDLQRQVRIEGTVTKVSREQSENYFKSRPKASQIGAWASNQSEEISDRSILENQVKVLEEKYAKETELPCPPHWGGYILSPHKIEFWQGRPSRLHDRVQYIKDIEQAWKIRLLAP